MRARTQSQLRPWLERLAWLGLFWLAGVGSMALVVWLLRGLMHVAGLNG
jgi:Protein of unknown function (DUF2474)